VDTATSQDNSTRVNAVTTDDNGTMVEHATVGGSREMLGATKGGGSRTIASFVTGSGTTITGNHAKVGETREGGGSAVDSAGAAESGGGDGSGNGAGSGCGAGSGSYCGSGSGSLSSSQKVSGSLAMLDYGVLRIVMRHLPSKEWSTILPTVFAGARHATMEGRKCSKDKERYMARVQAAQLNNPWYCAEQPLKGAKRLNW